MIKPYRPPNQRLPLALEIRVMSQDVFLLPFMAKVPSQRSLSCLPKHTAASFATLLTVIPFLRYNVRATDTRSLTCWLL